ncbi:hypothetical protein Taro_005508 [Colocasia esculenta]|uniref:Uncharacterized protein n=1 Tax=Colocasia esculenta TaxID=4460 RepID=A0A843TQ56_COLES|nr:hypothetical protein [Colocasia esculenta]
MATVGACRVWARVAAVLALVAVVGASTLAVYEGPGCTGNTDVVMSCGSCQTIEKHGGYVFVYAYDGGSAQFYSSDDCSDSTPVFTLTETALFCESFTYNSVNISCSGAAATTISSWDITARRQQQ